MSTTEAPKSIDEASDRAMDLIESIDVDDLVDGGTGLEAGPQDDGAGGTDSPPEADEAAEAPEVEVEAETEAPEEDYLGVSDLEEKIEREQSAWDKYKTDQYENEKRGWEAQQYRQRPEPPRQREAPKSKYLSEYADEDLTEMEVAARRELGELRSVVQQQQEFIQREQTRRTYEESQRRAAAEMAKYEKVFSSRVNPAVAKHAVRMVSNRIGSSAEPESLIVKRVVREVQDLAKEFHRMGGGKAAKPRRVTGGKGGRGAPSGQRAKKMTAVDLDKGRVQDAALRALQSLDFSDL